MCHHSSRRVSRIHGAQRLSSVESAILLWYIIPIVRMLIALSLVLAVPLYSYAADPMAKFEMRLDNVRVFNTNGSSVKTDLILEGDVRPGQTPGKFIPSVVSIRSGNYPQLKFSYEAIVQLATLFWEVAAYEVNQGTYKIILHYDLGRISSMDVYHPEKTHLSLDDVPLRQRNLFGRMLVTELHLFANGNGDVEAVNAKISRPGKLGYEVAELDIEPSYSNQWSNGRIFEQVLERNEESGQRLLSDGGCAAWIVAVTSGLAAAFYLLY